MIVKIVNDELIKVLGVKNQELNFNAVPPVSLLLVGLQGSGKTTTATKLSKLILKKFNKKTMLVSLDVYRPAAQEQLKILAEKNDIANLPIVEKQLPLDITKRAPVLPADIIMFDVLFFTLSIANHMLVFFPFFAATSALSSPSTLSSVCINS